MKYAIVILALALSGTAHAYTTLDCTGAYPNPVENTSFHLRFEVKVSNAQIKMTNRLSPASTDVYDYEGSDRSGHGRVYVNKDAYLMLTNRNWEPSQVELGEQLYVYQGQISNGRPARPMTQLNCRTVPTLTRF